MATRLLNKNELDAAKAGDRRREVEEGLKLARKVDGLRRTSVEEEMRLSAFRTASIAQTRDEIADIVATKNALVAEVEILEGRKRIALIPITEELDRLHGLYQELEEAKEAHTRKVAELRTKESEHAEKERLLAIEEERVTDERERSSRNLLETDEKLSTATSVLAEAEAEKERVLRKAAEKEWNLSLREEGIAVKEELIAKRQEEQEAREREQEVRHQQLLDREQTLLRNIQRNG